MLQSTKGRWGHDRESGKADPALSLAVAIRRAGPAPPLGNTVDMALMANALHG